MRALVFVFVIALALAAISTPVVRRFAVWLGFVDTPSSRKLHTEPMPLLGGVAIVASVLLAFLVLVYALPVSILAPQVLAVLASCGLIAVVGLVDDRRRLPAWAKLGGQFLAFLILACAGVNVQLRLPMWANYTLTFLWLAGISNAMNLLDNMDGLSAGVSAVAASFMMLLAAFNEQYLVGALAAALFGASLGFLRYNFKPARIFMGDAGALFLGFVLAVLGLQLRFPDNVNFVTWMVPVFILGLPIFDTTLVFVSRLRRGVNPLTTAGKDHLSHRLVAMGLSQRESVLVHYLLAGAFGMVGLFVTGADVVEGYAIGLAVALLSLYAIWRLESRWRSAVALAAATADATEGATDPSSGTPAEDARLGGTPGTSLRGD